MKRFKSTSGLKVFANALLVAAMVTFGGAALPAGDQAKAQSRQNTGLTVLNPQTVGSTRKVTLGLDKSIVVELPRDVRDVLVANPEVADAIVRTSRKIFLIGNRVGQTNVFMFDRSGNTVLSLDLTIERDVGPLQDLIKKYVPGSNVVVEIANDNVILTGTVPNPLAASRTADLAQAFVTGGEATTGDFTQSASSNAGASATDVDISNPDSAGRASSQVINLLRIEGEDQVHLKVMVAEIRRSVLKQLGVDFNSGSIQIGQFDLSSIASSSAFGANAFGQAGGLAATLFNQRGDLSNQFAVLEALERTNALRTLAEPTLTAQSGREATFLAGGEIGIPRSSSVDPDTGQVTIEQEFRPIGVSLSFTPVVQSPERISLTIATEVSDVDTTRANQFGPAAIPAIAVRRASSTIELPSGGSMVLGGLLRDDIRQSIQGVPYLKNIPVIGSIFSSTDFIRNETELVIIVTPYLVRPTARKNLTRPDKNYAVPSTPKGILFHRLNRLYGGRQDGQNNQSYHGRVGFIYK